VNVLLIPNPHLETPNYQVERLRHDASQLDEQTPSYEMVTVPAEEAPVLPTKSAEAKARAPRAAGERHQARPARASSADPVVACATTPRSTCRAPGGPPAAPRPQAPAPVAAAATPQPGLLDRIFGWFKKPAAAEPAKMENPPDVPAAGPNAGPRGSWGARRPEAGQRRSRTRTRRSRRQPSRWWSWRPPAGRGNAAKRGRAAMDAAANSDAANARSAAPRRPRRVSRSNNPSDANAGRPRRTARGARQRGRGEQREPREAREPRETREPREAREPREPRELGKAASRANHATVNGPRASSANSRVRPQPRSRPVASSRASRPSRPGEAAGHPEGEGGRRPPAPWRSRWRARRTSGTR
jgi:ribonuclease E